VWGWWNQPTRIDVQPPLQPDFVPFWQRGWFHMALLAAIFSFTIIILRLMARLALHAKEQRLLRRERARIARDIHDDLGTRMTKLVLDGEVAQSELPPDSAAAEQFRRMCEDIREVLQATDEILWAMNPQRDSLQDFSAYVCRYAGRFLKPAQIQCLLDVDADISAVTFDLPFRRSLLMAVKEALHNAVKHSEATELMLGIHRQGEGLVVIVEDNGKGFDPKLASQDRHGLANMAQRLDEMRGTCQITSQPGKGCRVQFSIPQTQVQRPSWWIKSPWKHHRNDSRKISEASEIAATRGHGPTNS
jgi:signal transduction histidine kinase